MITLLIIIITIVVIFVSIVISGVRINPVTIYVSFWGSAIIANILDWGGYKSVDFVAWLMIALSVLTFFLGSITISLVKHQHRNKHLVFESVLSLKKYDALLKLIMLFCVLSFVAIAFDWYVLLQRFGTIKNVFINANLIYTMRVGEGGLQSIPYLGSLSLSGCALAGIYFERTRHFRFLLVFPFILVILSSLSSMGRMNILLAIPLYINPFLINYGFKTIKNNASKSHMKTFVIIAASIVFIIGTTQIRIVRHGNIRHLDSGPAFLEFLGPFGNAAFSSIYTSVAGPIATFSSILNYDRKDLGQGPIPGMQTISPVFRLIAKTGLLPRISYYEESVYIGSGSMNVGTYLKDVYIDFGFLGVVIIPYVLGCIAMLFLYRWLRKGYMVSYVSLSFLYLFIEFSPIMNCFRLGYFVIPFAISVLSVYVINSSFAPLNRCRGR